MINTKTNQHELFMEQALAQAKLARDAKEVPIGALLVKDNKVIAATHNSCEAHHAPLDHAELKLIKTATSHSKNWRLNDHIVYVTLEPCPMCLGALFQARVGTLIIGCFDHKRSDQKLSAFPSLKGLSQLTDNNHTLQIIGGVLETECSQILKDFFKARRP